MQLLYNEVWLKMICNGKFDWKVSPDASKFLFNFDGNKCKRSGTVSSTEKTSGGFFMKTNNKFSEDC